jgi:hypothetical protein
MWAGSEDGPTPGGKEVAQGQQVPAGRQGRRFEGKKKTSCLESGPRFFDEGTSQIYALRLILPEFVEHVSGDYCVEGSRGKR